MHLEDSNIKRRTRTGPRNVVIVAGLFAMLTSGCSGSSEHGDTLAQVELKPGHHAEFIETEPGAVILREQLEPGAEAGEPLGETPGLAETTTHEERYRLLAGEDVDPAALERLRQADARHAELMGRYESGELEPPPLEPASNPGVQKASLSSRWECDGESCETHRDNGYDDGFTVGNFFWTWCPPEGGDYEFDGQSCWSTEEEGFMHTGWHGATSFFRSISWNSDQNGISGYNFHTLQVWYNGQWNEEAQWPTEDERYVNYYSWHPFTRATIYVNGDWNDWIHFAAVWNFE